MVILGSARVFCVLARRIFGHEFCVSCRDALREREYITSLNWKIGEVKIPTPNFGHSYRGPVPEGEQEGCGESTLDL